MVFFPVHALIRCVKVSGSLGLLPVPFGLLSAEGVGQVDVRAQRVPTLLGRCRRRASNEAASP